MGQVLGGEQGDKVKIKCKKCGHEWKVKPFKAGSIKSYAKCPSCNYPLAAVWPTR
jgi:hypothetical protein